MPLSKDALALKSFLVQHFESLVWDSGTSGMGEFPEFDLTPFDYLNYAEKALSDSSLANNINCVAHLKRAAACEIDTLIHVLNLPTPIRKWNFPRKLEMMGSFGFVSPRSISRLNSIRNAIEHDYSVPEIEDLQLYFDLISMFIYALEGSLNMLKNSGGPTYWVQHNDEESGKLKERLSLHYAWEVPAVKYTTSIGKDRQTFEFDTSDWEDFCFAMRTFVSISRVQHLMTNSFVVRQLEEE